MVSWSNDKLLNLLIDREISGSKGDIQERPFISKSYKKSQRSAHISDLFFVTSHLNI